VQLPEGTVTIVVAADTEPRAVDILAWLQEAAVIVADAGTHVSVPGTEDVNPATTAEIVAVPEVRQVATVDVPLVTEIEATAEADVPQDAVYAFPVTLPKA
jgi:hypothetical protein